MGRPHREIFPGLVRFARRSTSAPRNRVLPWRWSRRFRHHHVAAPTGGSDDALADLLLVDGDPLADISVLADPANLTVIMKDGALHKDTTG